MTEDERAIHRLVDTWMRATKAGDVAAVLELMTDDVIFMVPGHEPFGKQAFADASQAMQGAAIEGTSEIVELHVSGDLAYMRGRLQVSMTPPGSAPIQRAGYTLSVLRKGADGQWRIARDANLMQQV